MDMGSIYVIKKSTTIKLSTNKYEFLTISSIFALLIIEATNRQSPRGGVTNPIPTARMVIAPKCTGSTPKDFTIGKKMGVIIIIIVVDSINVPKII